MNVHIVFSLKNYNKIYRQYHFLFSYAILNMFPYINFHMGMIFQTFPFLICRNYKSKKISSSIHFWFLETLVCFCKLVPKIQTVKILFCHSSLHTLNEFHSMKFEVNIFLFPVWYWLIDICLFTCPREHAIRFISHYIKTWFNWDKQCKISSEKTPIPTFFRQLHKFSVKLEKEGLAIWFLVNLTDCMRSFTRKRFCITPISFQKSLKKIIWCSHHTNAIQLFVFRNWINSIANSLSNTLALVLLNITPLLHCLFRFVVAN